jgi:putative tricarboxylic transport membrane protein
VRRAFLSLATGNIILAILYLTASWQYPMGTISEPGPGLFPVMVACLWLIASVGTGWGALSKAMQGHIEWPRGASLARMGAILAAILAYMLLLSKFGHSIAAVVATFMALQALGGLRWPLKIGLAVAFGLGSYFLFDTLLNVPLPRGDWFR